MSKRDPHIISRINIRKVIVVTLISALIVVLILIAFLMEDGLPVTFGNLFKLQNEHPSLFLIELLPVLVFAFLYPMHKSMNRAIRDYEDRVKASDRLVKSNTTFAQDLSEGEDPEPYEEMMGSDLGRALRLIHLNIKSNRRKEREQTWIAEGKDIVSMILRQYQDLDELSYEVTRTIINYIGAVQGAFYLFEEESQKLICKATYAYNRRKYVTQEFGMGEGLVGQCAFERDYIYRTEIPEDYVTITSGIMGDQKPASLLLVPLISNEELHGILEFAFLEDRVPKLTIQFLLELGDIIARTFKNLKINLRTQILLEESRKMTGELQKNEIQLQENAKEMGAARESLEKANLLLERKIDEARNATQRLQLLLEHASEVISIYDEDLTLAYISPSVINIFGYSTEDMMAGKDLERIGKDEATRLLKTLAKLKEDPERIEVFNTTFIRKNGEKIYLQIHCRNMLHDPAIRGFVLNSTDVTETFRAEKEQRLKSRMQSLSENSLDLIIRIGTNGIIHYANPVVEDYTDIAPHTMINKNRADVPFKQAFSELLDQVIESLKESPVKKNIEVTLPLEMGEYRTERYLSLDAIPEFLDLELETILLVGHDITEAKRIEHEIKVQNQKVQDSINYAERIQSSILPELNRIRKAFPRSYILYKPRDVISGDFPWLYETSDSIYIAAVDCTGHGVPGALLSLVGLFLMNNLTGLHPGITAGELCEMLHHEVRKTLKQDTEKPETRDGMDMALCRFIKKESLVEFAGAHRPLYILSEGEITEYKGDRKSIGGMKHPRKPETPFTNHRIGYRSGDKFFFFTDGLTDQLGGPQGLKYGSPRVRQMILENPGYTMSQFYDLFEADHAAWMNSERQLDDLLMIGIEP